ncbi:MAG: hypothetical protein OHK0037_11030 [Elainellaceae cyanobacterium]
MNRFLDFARNTSSKGKFINECIFTQTKIIKDSATDRVSELASDNPKIISNLIELFNLSQDRNVRQRIIFSLGKVAHNNKQATIFLLGVLETITDPVLGETALYFLGKIKAPELLELVVRNLKEYEGAEVEDILWYCAQSMTYPDFYLAWNSSSNSQLLEE